MTETDKVNEEELLRAEILQKVKRYAQLKKPLPFVPGQTKIQYAGRVFDHEEMMALVDSSLDFWLTAGRYATLFELEFAKFFGTRFCLLTNSGSSADLLALSCLTSDSLGSKKLKSGDRVITCATGFPTTINPIFQNGLVPIFVDVELATYNADPKLLEEVVEKTEGVRAIMLAHTLGNPFDLDVVMRVARKHDLYVIEDCCDAVGAKFDGKPIGTFGDLATVSFYPAHHMSCSKNTPIPYLDPEGMWRMDTIEEIYAKYVNMPRRLKVLTFDKNNKVSWSSPSSIIRHRIGRKKMVKIVTQHGRQVEVTEDHSVFVLDKKTAKIVPVFARNIKSNDYLVATNNIPNPKQITHINVLDCFKNKDAYVENFLQANLKTIKNRDYAWQYKSRNSLPIRYLKRFNLDKENPKIGLLQSDKISVRISVTESLCRLIGYFLSEGSYSNGLVFSFNAHETNLVRDVIQISKSIFDITPKVYSRVKTCTNVKISSKNVEILFREKMQIKLSANNKRIPSFIYHADNHCIKAFIFAYTRGDGSITKLKDNTNHIDVTSTSKILLNDFQYLLSRLGISASFYRRNREKWNAKILDQEIKHSDENYTLRFSGYVYLGKSIKKQNKKNRNNISDQIPLLPLFRKYISVGKNQKTISKQRLKKYVPENFTLSSLLTGDVCFIKVRNIEFIEHDDNDYVYDFSVPGKENFHGGFLGLFLHNTMGEGGAVLTSSPLLKKLAESFRDWGRACWCLPGKSNTCGKRFGWQLGRLPYGYDHKYIYSHIGYNLKITDMQAAIGVAQLKKLPSFIQKRKENFDYYLKNLKDYEQFFILPSKHPKADPSPFGFPLTVKNDAPFKKNDIVQFLESKGIETRMLFGGNLIRQPAYQGKKYEVFGNLDNSDYVMQNTFWIGVYPGLSKEAMDYVLDVFRAFITTHKWAAPLKVDDYTKPNNFR